MEASPYLLSLAIWLPIAAGLLVLGAGDDRAAPMQRAIAIQVSESDHGALRNVWYASRSGCRSSPRT